MFRINMFKGNQFTLNTFQICLFTPETRYIRANSIDGVRFTVVCSYKMALGHGVGCTRNCGIYFVVYYGDESPS